MPSFTYSSVVNIGFTRLAFQGSLSLIDTVCNKDYRKQSHNYRKTIGILDAQERWSGLSQSYYGDTINVAIRKWREAMSGQSLEKKHIYQLARPLRRRFMCAILRELLRNRALVLSCMVSLWTWTMVLWKSYPQQRLPLNCCINLLLFLKSFLSAKRFSLIFVIYDPVDFFYLSFFPFSATDSDISSPS